jgi:hypothetical protein
MSATVEDLRACQMDIRLVQNKLQDISIQERAHPDKAKSGDLQEAQRWAPIKQQFEKRRRALKNRLAVLQEERCELEASLNQTSLSKASLAHVINELSEIEVKFTTDSWEDAWEALNAFIDWLEKDEDRISQEGRAA